MLDLLQNAIQDFADNTRVEEYLTAVSGTYNGIPMCVVTGTGTPGGTFTIILGQDTDTVTIGQNGKWSYRPPYLRRANSLGHLIAGSSSSPVRTICLKHANIMDGVSDFSYAFANQKLQSIDYVPFIPYVGSISSAFETAYDLTTIGEFGGIKNSISFEDCTGLDYDTIERLLDALQANDTGVTLTCNLSAETHAIINTNPILTFKKGSAISRGWVFNA